MQHSEVRRGGGGRRDGDRGLSDGGGAATDPSHNARRQRVQSRGKQAPPEQDEQRTTDRPRPTVSS